MTSVAAATAALGKLAYLPATPSLTSSNPTKIVLSSSFTTSTTTLFLHPTNTNTALTSRRRFSGKSERKKPHVNIGTIGHVDHGKTTITAALTMALASVENSAPKKKTMKSTPRRKSEPAVTATTPTWTAPVKNMITGAVQMDGAILVVSGADGPMSQTKEHILLAKQVGVPNMVVFLNKQDQVDDSTTKSFSNWSNWKSETSHLTNSPATTFRSSPAPPHLQWRRSQHSRPQKGENQWVDKIYQLMEEVDDYIPIPQRQTDLPILMVVEDVFSITGRGTVATERGTVRVGETIDLVGLRETRSRTVTGVEMFQKTLDEAMAGDNVGLLLRGVQKIDIQRGMVLAKPGTITPHRIFTAIVYVLKEEGGRHSPFFAGYMPQFYMRTTDVTGKVNSIMNDKDEESKMVMPGDRVKMEVELITPVTCEQGMRFATGEGGKTVGAGVIQAIIE